MHRKKSLANEKVFVTSDIFFWNSLTFSMIQQMLTLLPNKTLINQFGTFWLEPTRYSGPSPVYYSEEEEATFYIFIYYLLLMTYFWGTARRSNQSILKEISPGISLEGMVLKMKLQYFGHLMRKVDSLETTLMLGGIGGRRRRGRQRMRWLGGIPDSMDVSLSELREL